MYIEVCYMKRKSKLLVRISVTIAFEHPALRFSNKGILMWCLYSFYICLANSWLQVRVERNKSCPLSIIIRVCTAILARRGRLKKRLSSLGNKTGDLMTTNMEKAEVLNNLFASVFTGNFSPHPSSP